MAKPWDELLKRLFAANAQHFVNWLLPGAVVIGERPVVLRSRLLETDILYTVMISGLEMILHVEFQRSSDALMGKRLWEYNAMATITSGLPVYSVVIYLKKDRSVVEPPYRPELPNGQVAHVFYYTNIKLWELPAELFKQPGLEGLLPLLPLTRDGVRPEVVDEMITGIIASQKTDLLSIAYLLASLVFEKQGEHEWLARRFAMYQDILRESWAYQEILREGLEEGREQGLEEGSIQAFRQSLTRVVEARFPTFVPLAQQQISAINDAAVLENLIVKVSSAQTAEEAEQILLALGDDAQ